MLMHSMNQPFLISGGVFIDSEDYLYYQVVPKGIRDMSEEESPDKQVKAVFVNINSPVIHGGLVSSNVDCLEKSAVFTFLHVDTDFDEAILQFSNNFDFVIFNKDRQVKLIREDLSDYVESNKNMIDFRYYKKIASKTDIGVTAEELRDIGIINFITSADRSNECQRDIKLFLDSLEKEQLAKIKEYASFTRMSGFNRDEMLQKEMSIFCSLVRRKNGNG